MLFLNNRVLFYFIYDFVRCAIKLLFEYCFVYNIVIATYIRLFRANKPLSVFGTGKAMAFQNQYTK